MAVRSWQIPKRTRSILKLLALLAYLVLMVTGLFFLSYDGNDFPGLRKGTANLTGWNFDRDGAVPLSGEWDFYWNRFVSYLEVKSGSSPNAVVWAPSGWNDYSLEEGKTSGLGFGTYHLKVIGVTPGIPIALRVPAFSSSFSLYLDGELSAKGGEVSQSPGGFSPSFTPRQIVFTPRSSELDITIYVSNFLYANGGMWYTLYLGTPEQIAGMHTLIYDTGLFLIGAFFVMGLVFASIFALRRLEKASLYFALLCVIAILRTLIYSDFTISESFSAAGYELVLRIAYVSLYLLPAIFALLVREIFPEEMPLKAARGSLWTAGILSVLTLLSPVSLFTSFLFPVEIVIISFVVYIIVRLFAAYLHEKRDAAFILIGVTAVIFGGGYDTIIKDSLIRSGYFGITPVCFLIFLVLQMYVIARKFTETITERERALKELKATSEKERKTQLKLLRSQIKPHFIHNALNTVISISRSDSDKARKLLLEFSNYLRNSYEFNNLDDTIPIENELQHVRSYVILEQARFGDKLKVVYDIDDSGLMIPPLVLQPLVENAIVHGLRPKPEGGTITVFVKRRHNGFQVGVRDDGVGIPEEKRQSLLEEQKDGGGIALYNINQRLIRIYGAGLTVENTNEGGTQISFLLPTDGDRND